MSGEDRHIGKTVDACQVGSAAGKVSIACTESLLKGWALQKEAPDVLCFDGDWRNKIS